MQNIQIQKSRQGWTKQFSKSASLWKQEAHQEYFKKNPNRNYLQLFKGQANQQDLLQKQTPTKPENYYEVI